MEVYEILMEPHVSWGKPHRNHMDAHGNMWHNTKTSWAPHRTSMKTYGTL